MTRYVALLRGINLGSRMRVAMADLRTLAEGIGFEDVSTHLQSGNVLFTSSRTSEQRLAADLEKAVDAELGLTVPVVVRSKDDLDRVVAADPFGTAAEDPKRYLVSFFRAPATGDGGLDPEAYRPERLHLGECEAYTYLPDGVQRAKLSNALLEKKLGVVATARNWTVVNALREKLS